MIQASKYYFACFVHLLSTKSLSMMTAIAVVIFPGATNPLSEAGIIRLRLKLSVGSTILSIVIGTSTAVSVDPAVKIAVIGSEVKSIPLPIVSILPN